MATNQRLMTRYSDALANYQTGMSLDFQKFVENSLKEFDDPMELVYDNISKRDQTRFYIYMREAYPIWASKHIGGAIKLGNSFYQLRRAQEILRGRKVGVASEIVNSVNTQQFSKRMMSYWTVSHMIEKELRNSIKNGEPVFFGEVGKAVSGRIGSVARDTSNALYKNDSSFSISRLVPSADACDWCLSIVASFERSYRRGKSANVEDFNFHDHCNCVIDWE